MSRWVTFLAAFGALSLFMLASALLGNNGYEKFADLVSRIGVVAGALVWWEIRRDKGDE